MLTVNRVGTGGIDKMIMSAVLKNNFVEPKFRKLNVFNLNGLSFRILSFHQFSIVLMFHFSPSFKKYI